MRKRRFTQPLELPTSLISLYSLVRSLSCRKELRTPRLVTCRGREPNAVANHLDNGCVWCGADRDWTDAFQFDSAASYSEQGELVDSIAERIQALGGVSLAMAADVAETTQIERPPRGREEVPVQLSRLIDAHQVIIRQVRLLARRAVQLGDDGTNDLAASEVLRTNELQAWFSSEHLVNVPFVKAEEPAVGTGAA